MRLNDTLTECLGDPRVEPVDPFYSYDPANQLDYTWTYLVSYDFSDESTS